MNKNIVLIRPNSTDDKKDTYITFPLGLGYVASVLKNDGYNVIIMDLTIQDVDYDKVQKNIIKLNPYAIGITALSNAYKQVKMLSSLLKNISPAIQILGGHLAHHSYDVVLKNTKIDVCVIGEGEHTIIDLLKNKNKLSKVKGIAYKTKVNNIVKVTEPRELIQDLDSIPFPAYESFDMLKYTRFEDMYLTKNHVVDCDYRLHRRMSIEAGRGCPFSCNFCSKMYKKVRKRSVSNLYEEMKMLHEIYDVDTFWFQDELLFSNNKYMTEFCNSIEDMDVGWYGNARIDSVSRTIIQKAKDNKCLLIAYGVESGSAKILKNMNKKITPQKIIDTLKMTMDVGLPLDMGMIMGYPEEDETTIKETVDLLNEVGFPAMRFRYVTPYPGSKLYNDCKNDGLIEDEENYLLSLGDGKGITKFRFNFSNMSDERLKSILGETVNNVFWNYTKYIIKHPSLYKRFFQKDFMNPIYILYNRWVHPTDYDKACKK